MIAKYLFSLSLLVILTPYAYATEQQPDYIEFESETCVLEVSWRYPSPLEVFFLNSGKRTPFKVLHTANYRGHVATWALKDGVLFLTKVAVKENEIDLDKLLPGKVMNSEVKADWFSGVVVVKKGKHRNTLTGGHYSIEYKSYIFLRFNQGVLANKFILSSDEYYREVEEYSSRWGTNNPVVDGAIYEYEQYIRSFRGNNERSSE